MKVGMHDLVLDWCIKKVGSQLKERHAMLLHAYLKSSTAETNPGDTYEKIFATYEEIFASDISLSATFETSVRPWWSDDFSGDTYIHDNLAQHLIGCGRVHELVRLLSDAQWTMFRLSNGGLLAWNSDFEALLHDINGSLAGVVHEKKERFLRELKLIRDVVREAWVFLRANPGELPFQLYARLVDVDKSAWPVRRYLESARI